MSNDDPIRSTTSISSFLEAVNQKYRLTLPTDFSGDSPISRLLGKPIKVELGKERNVLYIARGDPYNFEKPNLIASVIITVQGFPMP